MTQLRDQARNRWPNILATLGIADTFLRNKHGPCPICGGKNRYRFDDKDGAGTWFCNQCRAGDGVDLLMRKFGWTFTEAAERVRAVLPDAIETKPKPEISPERARQLKREIWAGGLSLDHPGAGEARAYLASRGLVGICSPALRYIPSTRVSDHPRKMFLPALLALVVGPDGKPVNVHRTYLEAGKKADMPEPRRMMPGPLPNGSAIRLQPHDGRLGVAEGIETALAATRDFGVPCWSLVNTSLLAGFKLPDEVDHLEIFGDNDAKFGGQAAAYALAHRAATHPRQPAVNVHIPETIGADWADRPAARAAA
jgi:putative DNA primase/helicase